MANTECSILKLLEQVVDGEIKQTTPRWSGIAGINTLLTSLKNNINTSKDTARDGLTTQKGLIEHYTAIANSTKLPIILYSVPSRTGVNITPETCKELSKIENIVAIKEASRKFVSNC